MLKPVIICLPLALTACGGGEMVAVSILGGIAANGAYEHYTECEIPTKQSITENGVTYFKYGCVDEDESPFHQQ